MSFVFLSKCTNKRDKETQFSSQKKRRTKRQINPKALLNYIIKTDMQAQYINHSAVYNEAL
jgi:hypothetical protein